VQQLLSSRSALLACSISAIIDCMETVLRCIALHLALLGLAASAADPPTFTPPLSRPGESAWIPIRHQRQETNLCAPTSASMILEYFGDSISPREIKVLSRGKAYEPDANFSDFSITYFRDLIDGLARRGYAWREKDYPSDATGLRKGLIDIERSLDARIPVMIDTSPAEGPHTFVISGYLKRDHVYYAVDPSRAAPGLRLVEVTELASIWNSQGVGSNVRAVVFPKRRK
jgi:hypothetical protein